VTFLALTHTQDPIAWSHFDAEGEISFKSLIYIPATTPPQVNDLSKIKSAVKLFVRKVCVLETMQVT
jgi:heat shock protein beta